MLISKFSQHQLATEKAESFSNYYENLLNFIKGGKEILHSLNGAHKSCSLMT